MIEPLFAARMAPVLFRAFERGNIEQFINNSRTSHNNTLSALYAGIDGQYQQDQGPVYFVSTAKHGAKVAIVPMMGPITKNGDACSFGMRDYQNALSAIAKRQDISAVVMHYNNAPGGTHDGTPEMARFIKNYKLPVLSYVDGVCASAHYYMASQSDHIMMSAYNPSEVGSIGSVVLYQNIQNMMDAGTAPKLEIIRAPQSVNKILMNPVEPLSDNERSELSLKLEKSVNTFIKAVKTGRGEKLSTENPEIFSGKMYSTRQAIALGLADSKGTLMDAIQKAAALATLPTAPEKENHNQYNQEMEFPNLSKLFGKAESAEKSEQTETNAAQVDLAAAEAKLAEMTGIIENLNQEKAAVLAQLEEKEASITALTEQVNTLNGGITELQAKLDAAPAGAATQVSRAHDLGHENEAEPKYYSQADAEVAELKSKIKTINN